MRSLLQFKILPSQGDAGLSPASGTITSASICARIVSEAPSPWFLSSTYIADPIDKAAKITSTFKITEKRLKKAHA
jgi:hypothetical protein